MDSRFSFFEIEKDRHYLRLAGRVARKAREGGNNPFGAVLVDGRGNVLLECGNVERTERDCTGHAETALMRMASKRYDAAFLWNCSLYTTVEPCAMCSGAMYWGNLGRVVYGIDERKLLAMTADNPLNPTFDLPCREVFAHGQKNIVIVGPVADGELEREIVAAHEGYWN